LPWAHVNWRVVRQLAGADLGSAQVLEDGNLAPCPRCRLADAVKRECLRLMRAVREVETEDVGPGSDEGIEPILGLARGSDSCDDLRVAHSDD